MMLWLGNPSSEEARAAMSAGVIGHIATPAQGNKRPEYAVWCADNGCFSDALNVEKWWAFLVRNVVDLASCLFATAPDVVGDAEASRARSLPWLAKIRALGYPVAFVAQNGQGLMTMPWDEFDVLFLGGSPECRPCGYVRPNDAPKLKRNERPRCPACGEIAAEWKLGAAARHLVREAKARGKRVHMGRVNSYKRYAIARDMGCDSADGTTLAKFPKTIRDVLTWPSKYADRQRHVAMRTRPDQLHMFEGTPMTVDYGAAAAAEAARKRHPNIEQDGLFEMEAVVVVATKKKSVKPADHADCPTCPAEAVGRELRNGVLTWKAHMRRTIKGVGLPCSMSDQPVDPTAVVLCDVEGCLNQRAGVLLVCGWHNGLDRQNNMVTG